ncbi:MAG: SEC-C domain-containing protein [Oricola sp.]
MAKNKKGRNDLCWCGSGLKYKRCHLGREAKAPLPLQAIANKVHKAGKHITCLHPQASAATCRKVVSAHTLQRSRVLKAISDSKNHVMTFHPPRMDDDGIMHAYRRGWKEASTFTAFCGKHDTETFAALETVEFSGSPEQCFLIAYRAICWEFFQKISATQANPAIKSLVDYGAPIDIQQLVQHRLNVQQAGLEKGLADLREIKAEMDQNFLNKDYAEYAICEFVLDTPMVVAVTGSITPNRSLSGKKLQTLHDPAAKMQWLSFGVDISPRGVSVVFIWRSIDTAPSEYMREVMALDDAVLPRFLVQFFFAHCENTYFSEAWWQSLSEQDRSCLANLMRNSNPYYSPPGYDLARSLREPQLLDRRIIGLEI